MVQVLSEVVVDLAIVMLGAIVATVLAMKLRQPTVIALLLLGALISPNFTGIVKSTDMLSTFGELGAILILFVVGLEFSVGKLLDIGIKPIIIAISKITVLFLAAFELALLLGFGKINAIVLGMIFSITSTAIVVKILKQKWLALADWVPLMISTLVVEDIIAIFFLTAISNIKNGVGTNIAAVASTIIVGFFGLAVGYVAVRFVLLRFAATQYTDSSELYVFIALALVFGFTIFAALLGLSPSIGAFLAGSMVAELPFHKKIEEAINPFQLSFSAIFFISIGALIKPASIIQFVSSGGFLFIVSFMLFCFLAVAFLVKLIGNDMYPAITCGLALLPLGEFSLIMAKESAGLFPGLDIVSLAATGVFVTGIVCSVGLDFRSTVRSVGNTVMPESLRNWGKITANYTSRVIWEFDSGGYFFNTAKKELEGIVKASPLLAGSVICAAVFHLMEQSASGDNAYAYLGIAPRIAFYIACIGAGIALLQIIGRIKKITDTLSNIFSVGARGEQPGTTIKRVFYNMFLGAGLVIIGLLTPLFLGLLQVPQLFHLVGAVFIIYGLLLVYKSVRLVGKFTFGSQNGILGKSGTGDVESIVRNMFPQVRGFMRGPRRKGI